MTTLSKHERVDVAQLDFRQLFESVPGDYLVLEPDSYRVVAVSDRYLQTTGTTRASLLNNVIFDAFPHDPLRNEHNDVIRNLRRSFAHVRATKRADAMPVQYYPILLPGDKLEERWWSPINSPVFGPSGELIYIIHRVEDVSPFIQQMRSQGTDDAAFVQLESRAQHSEAEVMVRGLELQRVNDELHASEARLHASERQLRHMADAMPQVVWIAGPDGTITYCNRGAAAFSGAARTEEGAWEWAPSVHPDDLAATLDVWWEALRDKRAFGHELRIAMRDGGYRWHLSRGVPALDERGEVERWCGAVTDIHDLKVATIELERREREFETLVERSPDIVARFDRDLRHLYVNRAVETIGELAVHDCLGKTNAELGMPPDLVDL